MTARARPGALMPECAAVSAIVLAASLGGCGGGGFDAEGFIAAANSHGAGLRLGDPLETGREDHEVFGLKFAGAPAGPGSVPASDSHGGGTLVVASDEEAALVELARCRAAGELACFRAANVALYFGGALAPADLERVESALRALSSE